MSDYSFKRISESTIEDYIYIFGRIFGSIPRASDVKSKFENSNSNLKYLGFIAYHQDGEPAAFYGVFPAVYRIDGEDVLCAQSGSTMTLQNHQKKGLFVALAKKTYQLCTEEKVQFVFGIPNAQSHHGFEKSLKWIMPYRMQGRLLPLPTASFFLKANLDSTPSFFPDEIQLLQNNSQSFAFFKKIALNDPSAAPLLSCNSQRKLDYYAHKTGFLVVRNKCALWVKVDQSKTISIGDVFILPSASFWNKKIIIPLFIIAACLANFRIIKFYCSPENKTLNLFKNLWFKRNSLFYGYKVTGPDSHPQLPKKLNLTYGDYDTF